MAPPAIAGQAIPAPVLPVRVVVARQNISVIQAGVVLKTIPTVHIVVRIVATNAAAEIQILL